MMLTLGRILIVLSLAQTGSSDLIENYLRIGLSSNLALQQEQFSLQKSEQALRAAKGLFYPSLSLHARYTKAGGGRTIEFPSGDLLNPVYETLNQILTSQGLEPSFPTDLENEEIAFLREKEHETKLQLIQPLFQPELYYNVQVKSDLVRMKQAELSIFQRQLVAEIKKAYYTFLKAVQMVELLEKTELLLTENLRVSESLFQNGKATADVVYRSKAELSYLEQQLLSAQKSRDIAQSYFNFVLNRPLDAKIEISAQSQLGQDHELILLVIQNNALGQREEFTHIRAGITALQQQLNGTKSTFLPGLTGVFDYGYEGEEYRFSGEHDFWMASVLLRWNLFRGFQDIAQHEQVRLELYRLQSRAVELQQQILLEVLQKFHDVTVAQKMIEAAGERLTSTQQSFEIVTKKYQHGIAPHIEYLDARTALTNAEINHVIAHFDYQIHYAELERSAALYPIVEKTHGREE